MTHARRTLIAIGSYATANGLTTWWWDGDTAIGRAGSADLADPSFVCWHPTLPLLYAVSELDEGVLTAFVVAPDGSLEPAAHCPTGGAQPCWVTTDPTGRALLIANYDAAGRASAMTVIRLSEAGLPQGEPTVVMHHGSGPVADRQQHAHVHQVVPTMDGNVLASDLGADSLTEYGIDADSVTAVGRCDMPAGSGPRHIALAADGATGFVSGELDATVTVIHRAVGPNGGPGRWSAREQVPCAGPTEVPTDRIYPSQIVLSAGDRWLLVANRGPSTLAVLDVANHLAIRHEQPLRRWPRHFTIGGDTVLVACQHDNVVEALQLDDATGALQSLGTLATADGASPLTAPSCVAIR